MAFDFPFNPVENWDEEDGTCLFFKLDAGEPPEVTSPMQTDFDPGYFTHFARMPKEFCAIDDYVSACRASGIRSKFDRTQPTTEKRG
jgi:hypothetical protein